MKRAGSSGQLPARWEGSGDPRAFISRYVGPHATQASLREEHVRALEDHLATSYHGVNAALRAEGADRDLRTRRAIELLDELFELAAPIRSPLVAWRSEWVKHFPGRLRPGTAFLEQAYMSTTIDPDHGRRRAERFTDALLELHLAPGIKAVYIEDIGYPDTPERLSFVDPVLNAPERELLLERGLQLRIRQIHVCSDDLLHVVAAVQRP
jgi:hypothetical protein